MKDLGMLILVGGALVAGGWCFFAGPCKGILKDLGNKNEGTKPYDELVATHKNVPRDAKFSGYGSAYTNNRRGYRY